MSRRVTKLILFAAMAACVLGQSSSLYLGQQEPEVMVGPGGGAPPLSPQVAAVSLIGVPEPAPRQFAVNDLVEIIIRESSEVAFDASLDTEKQVDFEGEVSEFPNLQLSDLFNGVLKPGSFPDGPVELQVTYDHQFEGDGDYERSDLFIARMQARVADVKPNGTLVLEARKHIKSDKEQLDIVITGVCRAEDVDIDNTILSTKLFDLHLTKMHEGELRKATKKGILTQILEFIFNF